MNARKIYRDWLDAEAKAFAAAEAVLEAERHGPPERQLVVEAERLQAIAAMHLQAMVRTMRAPSAP